MRIRKDVALLTPEETAVKLRISVRKLQQMVRDGTAPEHQRVGRQIRFLIQAEESHE